jgi:hypothetical protein
VIFEVLTLPVSMCFVYGMVTVYHTFKIEYDASVAGDLDTCNGEHLTLFFYGM